MRALIVLALCLPAAASAGGFEVVDRGDAVEVIGHDMTAAKLSVLPVRSRLEIPLTGEPSADREFPADKTIRQVELGGGGTLAHWMSVKLNFERDDVRALAPFAKVSQIGNDLHVIIPRVLPRGATPVAPAPASAAAKAPEPAKAVPTPAPAPTPVAAAPVPAPAPAAPVADKPAPTPTPTPATAAATEEPPEKIDTKPAAEAPKPAAEPKPAPAKPALGTTHDASPGTRLPTLIALGLVAVAAGVWMLRRKRLGVEATSSITVIAQKSLGNKAKIVWLAAGPRELIVAVTPQQVRVLGQWKAEEGRTTERPSERVTEKTFERALERAAEREPAPQRALGTPVPGTLPVLKPRAASSPAVSGLLKLRDRLPTFNGVNEEVATDDGDADAAWAKEILAASGVRR